MPNLDQKSGIEEEIVADDGHFYIVIQYSSNQDECDAPAFLLLRHSAGHSICVGACTCQLDQTWNTRVAVIYDEESNSDSLHIGDFDDRIHGIVMLWRNRFQSNCLPEN